MSKKNLHKRLAKVFGDKLMAALEPHARRTELSLMYPDSKLPLPRRLRRFKRRV